MTVEKKIAGTVYRIDKLPAEPALKLYVKMNKVFAGSEAVLATIATNNTGRDAALKAFLHASMTESLDGDALTAFVGEVVALARVDGDPAILGIKPATLEDAIEVSWNVLACQFSDFLAESLGSAGS